jgi:hypothetical protein
MKPSDPFTSSHTRMILTRVTKLVAAMIADGERALKLIYGPAGQLRYKHYFGFDPVWQAGFRSEYGFHIRGTGETSFHAVEEAINSRNDSDPCPDRPTLPPPGTYPRRLAAPAPSAAATTPAGN